MFSNQITSIIDQVRAGGQSAPILLSEAHVCEVFNTIYTDDILDLGELSQKSISDFLYYDCGDKLSESHKAEKVREHAAKLHAKPAGDLLVALFRRIDILTGTSANALLHIFEDVPSQVLILVTSHSPQKIISTLQSRMLLIDSGITSRGENPLQGAISEYVSGKPEALFRMTLAPSKESKFDRQDALWIISGLQDAIECGKLPARHAKKVRETRILLETTNTIAKYLIDQLLISLACE